MAQIANTHDTAIILPDGTELPAGETTDVPGWESIVKRSGSVEVLSRAGVLVVADAELPSPTEDEKSNLQTKLAEAGIEFDKRWGVAKLRAALGEG